MLGGALTPRHGRYSHWHERPLDERRTIVETFDASAYVTENGTYSLGFANSNPSYSYVWSRDSSNPPVLEVTYEP